MISEKTGQESSTPPSPSSSMTPNAPHFTSKQNEAFQTTFEKNLNRALENDCEPPPPMHRDFEAYPAPPQPPPFATFHVPTLPRRSGIYLPTPIAVIVALVFLFETSIIVLYTAVALYQTLPAAGFPIGHAACQAPAGYGAINVAPNIFMPNVVVPSSSSSSASSTTPTPAAAPTVTATPTTQQSTTLSAPPVVTSTIFSTTILAPERSTVTSITLVTKSAV